eukprot:COSAG01_NODE_1476_length_10188_cov_16.029537_5_plen_112_part_00
MSRMFLSRNIQDGNGRAGGNSSSCNAAFARRGGVGRSNCSAGCVWTAGVRCGWAMVSTTSRCCLSHGLHHQPLRHHPPPRRLRPTIAADVCVFGDTAAVRLTPPPTTTPAR